MAKLTKGKRSTILRLIIEHRFNAPKKTLEERKEKVANTLYEMLYDEETRKKMNALPKGWLERKINFNCRTLDNGWIGFPMSEARPFKYEDVNKTVVYDTRSGESILIADYKSDEMDLEREISAARTKIKAVLESVNTDKQLVAVWPEAEQFIIKAMGKIHTNLPTVVIADLNKALDLPPEE